MATLARLASFRAFSTPGENLTATHEITRSSPFRCFLQVKLPADAAAAAAASFLPSKQKSLCTVHSRCNSGCLLPDITPARIRFTSGAEQNFRLQTWPLLAHAEFCASKSWCKTSGCGVGRSLICFSGGDFSEDDESPDGLTDGLKTSNIGEGAQLSKGKEPFVWRMFEGWHVPWDFSVTFVGMFAWFISFFLTGLAVALLSAYLGFGQRTLLDLEKQSLYILVNQMLGTIFGLGTIFAIVKRYEPLSPDLFTYDWKDPLDIQQGWLFWGVIGIITATGAIALTSTITSMLLGEPPTREETDALLQLLPIIGISPTSTVSLIIVTGVLAPLMEETIFRGFLLTSLSKWVPTPAAILLSSSAFAIAHLTPGEFPQLFALGVVLGLTYSQTRNLLTPIVIHSIWNSGVIILLTFLRLQGYDIRQLI